MTEGMDIFWWSLFVVLFGECFSVYYWTFVHVRRLWRLKRGDYYDRIEAQEIEYAEWRKRWLK